MSRTGFHLNWGYAENCNPKPQPELGVCTFMGIPISSLAGKGIQWPDNELRAKKVALDSMRNHGYRCQIPPAGWQPDGEDLEEGKEEAQYLGSCEKVEVMGKNADSVEFQLGFSCGWLYIRCNSEEAKEFVEENINGEPHYELALMEHDEEHFEISVGMIQDIYELNPALGPISFMRRTGGSDCDGVGTYFEMRKGCKTIAKALCSYKNGEMNNAGPTIELFEVAGECRRKGYGKILLSQMTELFCKVFVEDCYFPDPIKFNVCHCTNSHACEWFMRQGFEDWDGLGEELGKYLDD